MNFTTLCSFVYIVLVMGKTAVFLFECFYCNQISQGHLRRDLLKSINKPGIKAFDNLCLRGYADLI